MKNSAQKAKQIINQKVKEAEKQKVYDQFKDRIGDVILGIVQRVENGVVVNLGETEAILPKREQSRGMHKQAEINSEHILLKSKWDLSANGLKLFFGDL